MTRDHERRIAPRVYVRGDAVLDLKDGQLVCPLLDISSGGLSVLGPVELAPGTAVRVTFVDDGPLSNFELTAEVVRVTERNHIRTLGLRFSDGDSELAACAVARARAGAAQQRQRGARPAPGF